MLQEWQQNRLGSTFSPLTPKTKNSFNLLHPTPCQGLGLYVVGEYILENVTPQVYATHVNGHHMYRSPFGSPGDSCNSTKDIHDSIVAWIGVLLDSFMLGVLLQVDDFQQSVWTFVALYLLWSVLWSLTLLPLLSKGLLVWECSLDHCC